MTYQIHHIVNPLFIEATKHYMVKFHSLNTCMYLLAMFQHFPISTAEPFDPSTGLLEGPDHSSLPYILIFFELVQTTLIFFNTGNYGFIFSHFKNFKFYLS